MSIIRAAARALSIAAAIVMAALPAQAAFPDRAVHIILAFPPGSALDTISRLVGDELSKTWGQAVVIENMQGGSGNVGTERFARADPDGYTLLSTPPAPITYNYLLYRDLHYDATTFEPISLLARLPNVLLVRKDFEAQSIADFLRLAKASPGKFTYASQGVHSTGYLATRQLEGRTGIEMVHVPYRGAALALADIAAGHVDMMFDTAMTSLPLHRGGQGRILGVADEARSPGMEDIPTFAESGLPGFSSYSWFALAAPPGTPRPIVEKIGADVGAIIHRPDFADRLRKLMYTPMGDPPEKAAAFIRSETKTWSELVKSLHIEPE